MAPMRFMSQNCRYWLSSFYLLHMLWRTCMQVCQQCVCCFSTPKLFLYLAFSLSPILVKLLPPRPVKMSVESQHPKSVPYGMSFTPYPSASELIPQLLTVNLGKSGLRVSKVILGCMTYGSKEWQKWTLGEEEAMSHIKAAWVALFFTYYPCLKAFRLSRDELTMTPANLITVFRRGLIVRQNSTVACRQLL